MHVLKVCNGKACHKKGAVCFRIAVDPRAIQPNPRIGHFAAKWSGPSVRLSPDQAAVNFVT